MLCVMPYNHLEWFADCERHIIAQINRLGGAPECYSSYLRQFITAVLAV
jgi:hypothetical protein